MICPICGKAEADEVFLVDSSQLLRCRNDGLYFFRDPWSAEQCKEYYSRDFFQAPLFQKLSAEKGYNFKVYMENLDKAEVRGYPDYLEKEHLAAKESWGCRVLRWFREYGGHKPRFNVLEVGCAAGYMLKPFKAATQGWVYGLDISDWVIGVAKDLQPYIQFQACEVWDASFDCSHFDYFLFWDSFEHLSDPRRALETVQKMSIPGSLLILQTPDSDKHEGANWRLWSPGQHYYIFNHENIQMLFKDYGFVLAGEKVSPEPGEMTLVFAYTGGD